MVGVRFSNGFGNNLFQYIAARLIAESASLPLGVVARPSYYGLDEFAKLGLPFRYTPSDAFDHVVTDEDYSTAAERGVSPDERTLLTGYFEDYRHYLGHLDRIRSWFRPVRRRTDGDLAIHFRTGDRLFIKREFPVKPHVDDYLAAIERFDFNRLHIVSDLPEWRIYREEELRALTFHQRVREANSVSASDSVRYLNEFVEGLARFNPIFRSTSPAVDFDYLRGFDNILFEHGTLAWWAAVIGGASRVGVYGPWRPWRGDANRNLSHVPLDGWFTWDRLAV